MAVQYRAERTQSADANLARIIAEQEEIFVRRQPESARMAAEAKARLARSFPLAILVSFARYPRHQIGQPQVSALASFLAVGR